MLKLVISRYGRQQPLPKDADSAWPLSGHYGISLVSFDPSGVADGGALPVLSELAASAIPLKSSSHRSDSASPSIRDRRVVGKPESRMETSHGQRVMLHVCP